MAHWNTLSQPIYPIMGTFHTPRTKTIFFLAC